MKTTIIIPNYNGLSFMEPCFEALDRQTTKDFKILVVDNGSTDGSVEWLKEKQIPSIFLPENTGFSGAVNVGIQMYHPDLMDDAGDMYSVLGWAFQRGVGRPEGLYKKSCRVFTACAGAAIYRREVFETIGYFDEMHFAYLEDIDVGYRAKLYGYDNVFCPEAVVYHVGSGTSGSKYNSFKVKLAARNNVYLNYKNMRGWQLLLNSPCLLAGTFVKFLFFKKMGFGKDYVAGFLEGIRTLKNCKRVPSFKGRLKREIGIQIELIAGTAVYIYEFSRRQADFLKKTFICKQEKFMYTMYA